MPVGSLLSYVLLADSHTFVCRTWDDLAARLVWARREGYVTAKARRANGYVDRPSCPQNGRSFRIHPELSHYVAPLLPGLYDSCWRATSSAWLEV
jgi:hypothetical protein